MGLKNTMQTIKELMENKQDFPLMSSTLKILNEKESVEATVSELTDTILQDFALTNKLLKMVNSVYFIKTHYAGKVNTISRAIYVLGLDHVRNAAISLMIFDNIENADMARELKNALVMRFICGSIARELGRTIGTKEKEEAFLCAMYHNLGQLINIYYIPDEFAKIQNMIKNKQISEKEAVEKVLGISYEQIGINIAKEWRMSPQILYSMKTLPETVIAKPTEHMEEMRALANFSNEICSTINITTQLKVDNWKKEIDSMLKRYGGCFDLTEEKINNILRVSLEEYNHYATDYKLENLAFIEKLTGVVNLTGQEKKQGKKVANKKDLEENKPVSKTGRKEEDKDERPKTPEDIFTRGIQDIASSIMDDSVHLNDVLRMILEVMFMAMDFSKIIIMVMNRKTQVFEGRFGFGDNINAFLEIFQAPYDQYSNDIFSMVINHGTEILINDTKDPDVLSLIPKWFLEHVKAEAFILMPIIINNMPVAIIYADKPRSGELSINPRYIRYLRTLRNQAIMAIKQKKKNY
ncbi:MAG: HDOD domain-containing protein [Candidatus Magnetoovum sp. WYHC-5]|nr:HDOD domain-containing protein [Candidatus Magnetoovum sp. WYHC-5]